MTNAITPFENVNQLVGARYVHPDNMRLERIRAHAVALPPKVIKNIRLRASHIEKHLETVGYFDVRSRYRIARDEFNELMVVRVEYEQRGEPMPVDERRRLKNSFNVAQQCQQIMRSHQNAVVELRRLNLQIKRHEYGVEVRRAYDRARQILASDAAQFAQIITATLTQLNFCHRYSKDDKIVVDSVKLELSRNTPDAHFFKIKSVSRGWFGWNAELPQGVNPVDLMSEKTIDALEVTLQRRVESVITTNNGYWYKVYRLNTADGMIESLSYQDAIVSLSRYNHEDIPVALGVGEANRETVISLRHYPHFLVAGMSGSGKSNMVKNIISTMISRHDPDDLRLVLVDMKEGTEFKIYEDNDIPHLIGNVITNPLDFAKSLMGLEEMRAQRGRMFNRVHAVNIDEYNTRVPEAMRMPHIFVIIDEFNSIYLNDPRSDERENKRIANQCKAFTRQLLAKGRSAGIHLGICTQTIYSEILPGPDKANITIKIVGRLPTKDSSRVVIDNGDAADLPENDPRGRMIISIGGMQWQIQTPYMSPDDVTNAIEVARSYENGADLTIIPDVPESKLKFTREDMIELALNSYDGKVSGTKMWRDGIRDTGMLTFRECLDMAKSITKGNELEYNGNLYQVVALSGGGRQLILHSAVATHETPPLLGESVAENDAESNETEVEHETTSD